MANHNFVPVKVRYRVNKRRGVVLQRTYYMTRYICEICNRETSVKFEGTKNTDIKMICPICREMFATIVNAVGPDNVIEALKPTPKTSEEIIKESNKRDKQLGKRIGNMVAAGIIPKELLEQAILEKLQK